MATIPTPIQAVPFGPNGGVVPPPAPMNNGIPTQPMAPPPIMNNGSNSQYTDSDISTIVNKYFVIIGYIAPRKNTIKQVALDTRKAKEVWKAKVIEKGEEWSKLGVFTYGNKQLEYTADKAKKFSPLLFTALMEKDFPEELKALKENNPAYRIDTSEARVDRYILRINDIMNQNENANSSKIERATEDLKTAAIEFGSGDSVNTDQKIAVLTSKQLVAFLQKTGTTVLDIVAFGTQVNGKNPTIATLSLDMRDKRVTRTSKDGITETKEYKEVFCRIYNADYKRKTIRELVYGGSDNNREENKVQYCVLNDESGETISGVTAGQILNESRFGTLFPAAVGTMTSLPQRKILKVSDYPDTEEMKGTVAYKNAKAALKISWKDSGAERFGITEAMWDALSRQTPSGSGSHSPSEQKAESQKVLGLFTSTGVLSAIKEGTVKIR